MIRTVFIVRDNFYDKFGGDTHQINQYIICNKNDEIELSVLKLCDFEKNKPDGSIDFFILTNIDLSSDFIRMGNVCIKNKLLDKTLILPIHHNYKAMSDFNHLRFPSLWKILKLFGGVFFLEKMKAIYRMGKDNNLKSMPGTLFSNYRKKISHIIKNSRGLICIAKGEYDDVLFDFSVNDLRYKIVRNGILPYNEMQKADNNREYDVIVCGRIEARKNQLAILDALANTDLKILFLGGFNHHNKKYINSFKRKINQNPNAKHIDHVSPTEVFTYYNNSKVSLSASWFEVSSLADLEAASCGCYVFSSKNGHSSELIPRKQIFLVDPNDLSLLKDTIIKSVHEFSAFDTSFVTNLTWDKSSKSLGEALISFLK